MTFGEMYLCLFGFAILVLCLWMGSAIFRGYSHPVTKAHLSCGLLLVFCGAIFINLIG
jgi:hypothetical protein